MIEICDLKRGDIVCYYSKSTKTISIYVFSHANVFIDASGSYTTIRNDILEEITSLDDLLERNPEIRKVVPEIELKCQAMLQKFSKKSDSPDCSNKDDSHYYNMVNPGTGKRYDIPMLSRIDPEYFFKYIYYMKLKESSPDVFEKLLWWE